MKGTSINNTLRRREPGINNDMMMISYFDPFLNLSNHVVKSRSDVTQWWDENCVRIFADYMIEVNEMIERMKEGMKEERREQEI